jgi:hypothetical protein
MGHDVKVPETSGGRASNSDQLLVLEARRKQKETFNSKDRAAEIAVIEKNIHLSIKLRELLPLRSNFPFPPQKISFNILLGDGFCTALEESLIVSER